MMGNLLENAYRLCLCEIRISVRETLSGTELCVEDDGPGVPQDQRARILERGERLDRQHPGQGIGLAVVKDIIESYSAKLTLGIHRWAGRCSGFTFRQFERVFDSGLLRPLKASIVKRPATKFCWRSAAWWQVIGFASLTTCTRKACVGA